MTSVTQSPPHIKNVWEHTLDTLRYLETITNFLSTVPERDGTGNLILGLLSMKLGRYRDLIKLHLEREPVTDRSVKALLFFATLYHDVGKPSTRSVDESGRIRYLNHDEVGAKIISQRAKKYHFSKTETDRLATIVRHHMRPSYLSHNTGNLSKKAIYRFFRDTSDTGVDICLLSLADVLATYGPTLPQERWEKQINTVRTLLEIWWEKSDDQIKPPALITGHDLITNLQVVPGPIIGEILEAVQEAQIEKEIISRNDALIFAMEYLNRKENG